MKAKELRIGNYIDSWRIGGTWEPTKIKSGKEIDFVFIQDDNKIYRPIPITEDWLLEFGFIETDDGLKRYQLDRFKYDLDDSIIGIRVNFFETNWQIVAEPTRYVHQLQNLTFALTGKELI